MDCCQCPSTSLPLCRRLHMSRCRQCRPADALGAIAPYREASSGGLGGLGGGLRGVGGWGWGGRGGDWGGGWCFVRGHLHPTPLPCPPQREEHPGPVVRGLRTWFILSPATL